MHDSDSGIGIDSGIIPLWAGIGIGIGIGIRNFKKHWNNNKFGIRLFGVSLESESGF